MARPRLVPGSYIEFEIKRTIGIRNLVAYVATRLSIPVAWVICLAENGQVHFNAVTVKPDDSSEIVRGSRFRILIPEAWPPHMQPTAMELDILYEDPSMIVVNKPAGIVVHPARGHMDSQTLQNGILHRYQDQAGKDGVTIGPAHRLDRDTSGVLVFSRTRQAYSSLTQQFADNHPHKEYLALVEGKPDFVQTAVTAPLGIDRDIPCREAVVAVHDGGKNAQTDLFVLKSGSDWSFLRACPKTGRAHQIRVHLKHLGLPVMGDRDYNPRYASRPISRQALHASALTLTHPVTGTQLSFKAPMPDDMSELLNVLNQQTPHPARKEQERW